MKKVKYLNKEYFLRYPTTLKALKLQDRAILCESEDGTGGFSVPASKVTKA